MEKTKWNRESLKGTFDVLLSALFFSTGGVLIKLIPWSSWTIQGIRSGFAFLVIAAYMVLTKHRFVWNKTVLFGGLCNVVMGFGFVAATKLTTAANAIVLQFTEPIFVIFLTWLLEKKRPGKDTAVTCAAVMLGIIFAFSESLSGGAIAGNLLAIFSGFGYALVVMIKKFPGSDFESSMLVSHVISILIGIPACMQETQQSVSIWGFMILLGVFQFGFSYIFLSRGLDHVSPVTASLTSAIEPVLNPLLVAIVCGETLGVRGILGAVLVVGAATVYNLRQAMGKQG
ncbi:MAG: DMT family transporter [Roseburia sp.]